MIQKIYEESSLSVTDLGGATALTYRKIRLATQRSYDSAKEAMDALKNRLI
ncbi:hypothetical protein SABR111722_10850 [Saccharibacillus brassicae]